jgi:cell wall-associated NlpC family hydrolase
MARLGSPAQPPLPVGEPAAPEHLLAGTVWRLRRPLDLFSRSRGQGLASQAAAGRCLRILATGEGRLRVRLLEDGYPGWIEADALLGRAVASLPPLLPRLQSDQIAARIEQVLAYGLAALERPNRYLWGGSLGPDYDCSGLVQTAFAAAGIWLPRDAYLQERFCQPVAAGPGQTSLLQPGDLLFFGTPRRCTHVALHLGEGRYLHSSGQEHGRNGLGVDDLHPRNDHPVARHYQGEWRGAGRVMHSHDGSPLPP